MFYILVLILISVSIDSQTTYQSKWCQHIQTNGTSKELGIYHRFRNGKGEGDYVMFNRAGAEWLFNITRNGSDKYHIIWRFNETKLIEDKGIVYRFGIYRIMPIDFGQTLFMWRDCYVRDKVKNTFF